MVAASGAVEFNSSTILLQRTGRIAEATISQNGTGGIVNVGNGINTLTIVGGRIQNQIKNINSTARNVFFDGRFGSNGFAPPWFPSTTVAWGAGAPPALTSSVQRIQWLNKSSYF